MDLKKFESGAVASPPDAPESPSDGYPSAGNPATATPATKPGPYWFYQIDQELRNLIESEGLTPDHTVLDQINTVINAKIAAASTQVPVGGLLQIWDHITGVDEPDNSGTVKYIKLTAGEDGAGEYNEGLLTSESVSGTSPDIDATAVIDYASSPMDGQTVKLINTSRQFIRPGKSGVEQDDQFKSHGGHVSSQSTDAATGSGDTNSVGNNDLGGDETRPRNIGATYYMRIA
ncbi:hypothetical protein [Methylophaga sp.]|uniref:hypothetical protein n=1 Tax=Methylophaga sp. TaxID=2024840 RepID=UPI003A91ADC5